MNRINILANDGEFFRLLYKILKFINVPQYPPKGFLRKDIAVRKCLYFWVSASS